MKVIKRNGSLQDFDGCKIVKALEKTFTSEKTPIVKVKEVFTSITTKLSHKKIISVEEIQDIVEKTLMEDGYYKEAKSFILYRERHKKVRDFVKQKINYINQYKKSDNTANATIDDNSNVKGKNIGILNTEIHKEDNLQVNRGMVVQKLRELYPDFDAKQYLRDLEHHVIYKHDENSFAGAISPYCCSISMYPFLTGGLKELGGLSAAPQNLDSFCGMYINLIFAVSSMFAGAVATSEVLLIFDYFARKEWGDNYYLKSQCIISSEHSLRKKTIRSQIHQYFQQIVYSINQPAAARGLQSAFVNFSLFDKPFFEGMFGNFIFPDNTKPKWESLCWLQKEFLHWFNQERLHCILTFPVVSCTLLYKDGTFADKDFYDFICQEYAEGNSFFTYISDTVDSLSSCCRLKNKVQTHEFNFTNGNMGVMTGSKSVISINLNRIVQDWKREKNVLHPQKELPSLFSHIKEILKRVYLYQNAYNELLWDMYNARLLPVYEAGFINLNKQYLTIGLIGVSAAAQFLGYKVGNNKEYATFCAELFSTIKEENQKHKTEKTTWNTEQVPAESAAIKLYNADREDGYQVPREINLYTSYIFNPYDKGLSVLDKITMHGKDYIGDYLDGGSAAHINLDAHLNKEQYKKVLGFAAIQGCQYLTFNIPNCECEDCGYIAKQPFEECPKCHSRNVALWDRVIGYLTKIKNWSEGRQIEQKKRVYANGRKELQDSIRE